MLIRILTLILFQPLDKSKTLPIDVMMAAAVPRSSPGFASTTQYGQSNAQLLQALQVRQMDRCYLLQSNTGQHVYLRCRPPADLPFFKVMVPTVDTVRVKFIASSLVRGGVHTLLVGGVGVGKTMMASSVLEGLPNSYGAISINFSAQTSSNSLQDTIEGKLEKRTKVSRVSPPARAASAEQLSLQGPATMMQLYELYVGFCLNRACKKHDQSFKHL